MISGYTDSVVSKAVARKLSSVSFPLCAVAMELAAVSEKLSLDLSLKWCPREMNDEADALSNADTSGFDPALRIEVD